MTLHNSVTKCTGKDGICLKKHQCFRYTKPSLDKYQSWLCEVVAIPDVNKCNFFMDNFKNN